MLKISETAFKAEDGALIEGVPACTKCAKNTGFNRTLFDDISEKDLCTDADCFHRKVQAHIDRALTKNPELIRISSDYSVRGWILMIRCENISWETFTLSILTGKSAAAKRDLPLTDRAYDALHSWWVAIGRPKVGYLFPAIGSGSMHLGRARKRGGSVRRTDEEVYRASRAAAGYKSRPYSDQRVFDWHHDALEAAGLANAEKEAGESLVPYHFRHSALTRLAENCPNPYAIAAAAGHSSITMTYRYVHPQKREIWAAFEKKSGHKIGHTARKQNFKIVGSEEVDG